MVYETPVARELRLEREIELSNAEQGIYSPDLAAAKIKSGEFTVSDVLRLYRDGKIDYPVPKKDLGPAPSWDDIDSNLRSTPWGDMAAASAAYITHEEARLLQDAGRGLPFLIPDEQPGYVKP
jgi:hypothetical protein